MSSLSADICSVVVTFLELIQRQTTPSKHNLCTYKYDLLTLNGVTPGQLDPAFGLYRRGASPMAGGSSPDKELNQEPRITAYEATRNSIPRRKLAPLRLATPTR